MSRFEMRLVDLKAVTVRDSIAFHRMEFLDIRKYGPTFGGRVRYARDGVEQRGGILHGSGQRHLHRDA